MLVASRQKRREKMRTRPVQSRTLFAAALTVLTLAVAVPANTYGEPPPWAPAHGWRKKNDPHYTGYTGRKWDKDYGVLNGRCNREAVGAVIGGVAGGAIGSQVGKGSGRQVAIVVGTITGAVIGAQVGRDMDQADRACMGHALELAADRRRVSWQGADSRTRYLLTPVQGFEHNGAHCREFDLTVTTGRSKNTNRAMACPTGNGAWRILG
jgi:surface antigen